MAGDNEVFGMFDDFPPTPARKMTCSPGALSSRTGARRPESSALYRVVRDNLNVRVAVDRALGSAVRYLQGST